MAAIHAQRYDIPDEADLVSRAARGEEGAVRTIMQTHNRRLYRVARSIVRDGAEAEDVLQEAYLHAFRSLAGFRGEASLATWLTRIVLNEALQRVRRHTDLLASQIEPPSQSASHVIPFPINGIPVADPERAIAQRQLCQLVERAIDELPQDFRTVLVARVVEGMSVDETAALLRIRPATVRSRLHRARRTLRVTLANHIGPLFSDVFPFDGQRCERITNAVVLRLNLPS